MHVAIRVDSSAAIGGGHVQRCLSLAHALRDTGADVRFVQRDLGDDASARPLRAGFEVLRLPPPGTDDSVSADVPHAAWAGVHWRKDADQTCELLRGSRSPQCVVVDHYAFDARWHAAVNDALGADIAVIDDLADRPLHGRWLVDHNLHADHRAKYAGRWPTAGVLLGGPRHALLGPAFADAARHECRDEVRSIGIFLGSSDASGLSAIVLRACREVAGFGGDIEVVTTSGSPTRDALAREVALTPKARLSENLPNLSDFFARHDLQVGAGGGATWERCCIGIPSVLLTAAANQAVVVPELDALGLAIGLPEQAGLREIGAAVRRLIDMPASQRSEMSLRAQQLVDGLGARRVALRVMSDRLSLRPVTLDDAELTHRWRNHASTRAVSRDPGAIDSAAHRRWLGKALVEPRCRLWIARVGRIDVGVIRFDDDASSQTCEVSLYLDPALRGLGLGAAMLRAGEQARRTEAPAAARFTATVLPHNPSSRRLFESAGYRFDGDRGDKAFHQPHPQD